METLVVHIENKEQLTALKAFMKAMKINFEPQALKIPKNIIAGIEKSRNEAKEGKLTAFNGTRAMLD